MAESPRNIRTLFNSGNQLRQQLEISYDTSSSTYSENLQAAITAFSDCRRLADEVSLFSQNETLEDVASGDLPYLLIDYYLAELILLDNQTSRKTVLERAQEAYEKYLHLLDTYEILSVNNRKLHERYLSDRKTFSTASTTDAAARRDTKISRFRQEKELKEKLDHLGQNPASLQNDDAALRDLHIASITLCTHRTFHSLDMIAQELQLLAFAPPPPHAVSGAPMVDERERERGRNGRNTGDNSYSYRLDAPLSQLAANGKAGPILSKEGKPLQPFVLLDQRQRIQQGVFRSGHNLPTMTIDEYLEEEKRRGGIVEGGGEQSGLRPEVDEDDIGKADEETMKAREWDEFTEANPKGSGNTLNRG